MHVCTICQWDREPTEEESPYLCQVHRARVSVAEAGRTPADVDSARIERVEQRPDAQWIQGQLFD